MEQGMGSASNGPPSSIDKSRVLEIKPLRCLVPVFPNGSGASSVSDPQPAPFVCVPPSGPFPPGVQPFYPFQRPNGAQSTAPNAPNQPSNFGFGSSIPAPVPLNSFRTPTPKANGQASGRRGRPRKLSKANVSESEVMEDEEYSSSQNPNDQYNSGLHAADAAEGSNSVKQRGRPGDGGVENDDDFTVNSLVDSLLTSFKLNELDDSRRTNGDKDTVATILLAFDLLRKRLTQLEEARDLSTGIIKRPDLKASSLLMAKGVRTNNIKRIGHVPGIEVGDIFYLRMELCMVGLHAPSMAGIDYLSVRLTGNEEPLAVSIVSSGGYDDNGDDGDVLIYSGQGGVQRKDGKMLDQKLERGNLALEKSLHRGNEVRVMRGLKENPGSVSKFYMYDGLYKIQESWAEKQSGCNVFKYKLVRSPGQPEAFSLWKSIQQWKEGTAARSGIILPDLTSGAENQPVTLVNDVNGEKGPTHFSYISTLKYSRPFPSSKTSIGCHCLGGCQPGDTRCPCNQRNDGYIPYSALGLLLTNKSIIYECGPNCSCPPTCRNRMSQAGLKVRLEVFKTKNRGWGLRSWDPIRAGGFICEYAGVVKEGNSWKESDCNYTFDATRYYEPLQTANGESDDLPKAPFPLVISAEDYGNVARFMNHSCSPNVFWKPVLRESNNESYLHIAFFAIGHISPFRELTFDYGKVQPEKGDRDKKKCLCGSTKCRGYYY